MEWLALIKSLIGGVAWLTKYLADRQLIETGEAKQIARRLLRERDLIDKAIAARNTVKHNADGVLSDKQNRSSKDRR